MTGGQKEIFVYETSSGRSLFDEWLNNLPDRKARAVISARVDRLERGNAGKCESVGDGVYELKIYFGPGYRVYFGEDGNTLIVLLCGGDKGTQMRDIQKAKEYWADYEARR